MNRAIRLLLKKMNALWCANYLSARQIYLYDNSRRREMMSADMPCLERALG
jgi:hypothetical protein